MAGTLVGKYGRARLVRIVSAFYTDVLRSPTLGHYFSDVPIEGLIGHQTQFLEAAMGGPQSHTPEEIMHAHRPYSIGVDDFEEMMRLLKEHLVLGGLEDVDADQVIHRYRALHDYVVTVTSG